MKKILFLSLIAFCSCTENQDISEMSNDVVKSVDVSFSPMEDDSSSRLVLTDAYDRLWESNDTIGIFPNIGGQVEFPVSQESIGTTTAKFTGGGWGLKSGYSYSAYYPYNFYNRNPKQIPFSYEGQVQNGTDTREHLSRFLLGVSSPKQVSNGGLNFQMDLMGCIMRLYITLPKAATYTSLELYADSEVIPVKKSFNILHKDVEEKVESYSNRLKIGLKNFKTTTANQEVVVWAVFPSMAQSSKTLKAVLKDSQGYVYVGDVSRVNIKDGSYDFYLNTKRSSAYRLKASPVQTDGFSGGIEDWVNDGQDYGGVAK